jgi:hypothetical protein
MMKIDAADTNGLSDRALTHAAEELVKQNLKDPDSAKFRNEKVYRSNGLIYVCGELNSNNSFGGYGGFERFLSDGDSEADTVEDDAGKLLIGHFCTS